MECITAVIIVSEHTREGLGVVAEEEAQGAERL